MANYNKYTGLEDIFSVHCDGIITSKDQLTIQKSPGLMFETVKKFAGLSKRDARKTFNLGTDTVWSVKSAQDDINRIGLKKELIVPIMCSPFDTRYTFYTGKPRGFHFMPRPKVMKHMLKENICLVAVRQFTGEFNHCYVADTIVQSNAVKSIRSICRTFPLYMFRGEFREDNIKKEFQLKIVRSLKINELPSVREIFSYIYAILNSNVYSEAYKDELENDFPRIPMPPNLYFFKSLVKQGNGLCYAHLLRQAHTLSNFASFVGEKVTEIRYQTVSPAMGNVLINQSTKFSEVPPDIWEFKIGGHLVLPTLVDNLLGQKITYNDIQWFSYVACALAATIDFKRKIDKIIRESGIMS